MEDLERLPEKIIKKEFKINNMDRSMILDKIL